MKFLFLSILQDGFSPSFQGWPESIICSRKFDDHLILKNNEIIYGKTPIYRDTRSIDLGELICVGSDGKEQ